MAAVDILRVSGDVIEPGDERYDAVRATFYGGIDKRPAAIVRVTDDEGVARVVAHARETGRELAVRSGGHSVTGAGVGFLVRKYGLTIDSLLAADVVTADGVVRRVDAENEPDLFWAIRGGGGNFGVVTRFQFRLRDVDPFTGGMLMQPASATV